MFDISSSVETNAFYRSRCDVAVVEHRTKYLRPPQHFRNGGRLA